MIFGLDSPGFPEGHRPNATRASAKLAVMLGGWWSQSGSNRRPSGCKPDALPAELWPHDLLEEPAAWVSGGTSWTRTNDLTLIKRLLYQLSYGPDATISRQFIGGP